MPPETPVPGVAEAIEQRRTQLGMTIGQMVDRSGVTSTALAPLRKGYPRRYNDVTKFGLADALQWRRDAVDRLFAGETPDESWERDDLAQQRQPGSGGPPASEVVEYLRAFDALVDRIELVLGRLIAERTAGEDFGPEVDELARLVASLRDLRSSRPVSPEAEPASSRAVTAQLEKVERLLDQIVERLPSA